MTTKLKSFEKPVEKRTWLRFGMSPLEEKLDLSKGGKIYSFKVAGHRSDGEWIALPIILDKDKANLANGWDGCIGTLTLMSDCFAKLETYLLCDCYPSKNLVCKTHDQKPS